MRIRLKLDRMHQLLARTPISQNHWAVKLGLSKGHLSSLLAGKHLYPSGRTRERMLEVLQVPFEDLFEVEYGHELPDHGFQQALSDQYLLDHELGRGGMGIVYQARDIRLGRSVAIKVVNAEVVSGVGSEALLREIINTNRLQHPNVLSLLDAGEADGCPYYVMPFVRGGSLRELLKRDGRLPVGRSLHLLSGVAAALEYANSLGILHCDVKPGNVLVADDHAWLIDFGIARVIQAEVWSGDWRTEFDSGAGTPAYVSPEQATGSADLDARSDVYSLACMMFEMLAGRPPFEGSTTLATVALRFTGSPPALREFAPHLPGELSDAILRAMAVNRAERTSTAGAFLRECRLAVANAGSMVGIPARQQVPPAAPWFTFFRSGLPMGQEIVLAWRSIRRTPGIAFAICLTLGLGIGVNAVMFGMLDRLFLRPPPHISAPEQIRRLYVNGKFLDQRVNNSSLSYPVLQDFRGVHGFAGAAGFFQSRLSLERGPAATSVSVLMASHDFFPLLGVKPAIGRFYLAEEDVEGAAGTAVLSYAFWEGHFSGDPGVLGRSVNLGSGQYTVIGVAPEGFNGVDLQNTDFFVPLNVAAHENIGGPWATSRGIQWVRIITRVRSATEESSALAEATARIRAGQITLSRPDTSAVVVTAPLLRARGLEPGRDAQVSLWLGGVSIVLLIIAAANVINLLLTRLTSRTGEFAVRLALGASRNSLIRQIMIETLALTLLAALAGLLIAQWAGHFLGRMLMPGVAQESAFADPRVLGFTVGISVIAGLIAGVFPAWRGSNPDLVKSLKSGRGGSVGNRSRLRSGLQLFQASLSFLLLVAAGLFVRSMRQVRQLDAGLDLNHLLVATADFESLGYTPAQVLSAQQTMRTRIAGLSGVAGIAGTNSIPFATSWAEELVIPGIDSMPAVRSGGPYINRVDTDYFAVAGTKLVAGRLFNAGDQAGAERIVILGETMARLVWPGRSPLGACLKIGGDSMPCSTVVGVVHDAPRGSLLDRENMQYYVPATQYQPDQPHASFFIRSRGNPEELTEPIRRTIQGMAAELPVVQVQPLWELAAPETRAWQLGATLFSLFGGLAMLVAVIGLYSLVSFGVAQRTREFGIRTALGATTENLLTMVLTDGLRLIGTAIVIGLVGAILCGKLIAPMLYMTSPMDPVVYLSVTTLLLTAAVAACLIPARRAARAEPTEALRAE